MDLFEHRYYRLGKILMSLIGQWPHQSIRVRRGIFAVLILLTTYQMAGQILAIVKYRDDWDILLECFVPNIFDAVCTTKYLGFRWNPQKTLKLVNRIRTDWQIWARDRDVNILHAYAQRAHKIIILYTALWYSATFLFMIQPMIAKLIDVVLKNDTEPGTFPFPVVYYPMDMQKYYFYLITFSTVYALYILTALVASDIMLIIYVQHVCSLFAAVGHKLERIGSSDKSTETGRTQVDFGGTALGKTDMVHLVSCIVRHNDAIEYADLIKTSYAWNLFFTVGFGVILVNSSGLQILLKTSDLGATLSLIVITLDMIGYFYVETYIAQILMDHSINIRYCMNRKETILEPPMNLPRDTLESSNTGTMMNPRTIMESSLNMRSKPRKRNFASLTTSDRVALRKNLLPRRQNSQWYRVSIKAQKLLQIMTMRCNVPCQLTIGNVLVMSVQTFWSILRTSVSYFAFVRTMRPV